MPDGPMTGPNPSSPSDQASQPYAAPMGGALPAQPSQQGMGGPGQPLDPMGRQQPAPGPMGDMAQPGAAVPTSAPGDGGGLTTDPAAGPAGGDNGGSPPDGGQQMKAVKVVTALMRQVAAENPHLDEEARYALAKATVETYPMLVTALDINPLNFGDRPHPPLGAYWNLHDLQKHWRHHKHRHKQRRGEVPQQDDIQDDIQDDVSDPHEDDPEEDYYPSRPKGQAASPFSDIDESPTPRRPPRRKTAPQEAYDWTDRAKQPREVRLSNRGRML